MLNSYFQMNSGQYRQFLVKIKHDFHTKTRSNKVDSLSIEDVAQLLYLHTGQQPMVIRQFLLKGTGKFNINWDDLLQYLEEDITLLETVKKMEHSPMSATEIVESNINQFGKLLHYIKKKQTNVVYSIERLPTLVAGEDIYLVFMDKELVIYDLPRRTILNSLSFSYSNMREKIMEKEEQKRMQRDKISHQKTEEYLDKVQILNASTSSPRDKKSSAFAQRFLTSNFKTSVRGSSLSSETSNDHLMFKRPGDSGIKKKSKSSQIKIKNDDVGKIFEIFENANIKNSIAIANAFTQSRNNFQKQILLDRSLLQKQKKQQSFGLMSQIYHNNFDRQIKNMRRASLKLNKVRTIISSQKSQKRKVFRKGSVDENNGLMFRQQYAGKSKQTKEVDYFSSIKNKLQIVDQCIIANFLLVSLFNREIRLFTLKKGIQEVKSTLVFQKQFKFIVTSVEIYKSTFSGEYRIALIEEKNQHKSGGTQDLKRSIRVLEEPGTAQFQVFHLNHRMNIKAKVFQHILQFSPKYQSALPFGAVLYDEKGHFSLFELNRSLSKGEQVLTFETTLTNPQNNYKLSITKVKMHKNLLNFYICCSSGFVYLFDRLSKRVKYHAKVSQCPILDIMLIKQDCELIALSKKGSIIILSTIHLQKIYSYQSYHDVVGDSKLLTINQESFYVYSSRYYNSYSICANQQKQFNFQKPAKVFKNRIKLRNRSREETKKDKTRVIKILQGKGGKGNFLALLLQNGQICFIDPDLQYIGSYYYLQIHNIVDIISSDSYQYIALLSDDNTLEVLNLYTQNILFTVSIQEEKEKSRKGLERKDSLIYSVTEKLKPTKNKSRQTIILTNIFSLNNPSLFLGVITQGNTVHHYSEKGNITLSVNLEKRCGEGLNPTCMIYVEECLVLVTGGDLTVLHRQSYYKKWVISISNYDLMRVKKVCRRDEQCLICIDSQGRIYIADVNSRKIELISHFQVNLRHQQYQFNQFLIYQQKQSLSRLKIIQSKKEKDIPTDTLSFFFAIIKDNFIRVNKQSGKIDFFSIKHDEYQEIRI